jgi:hypothetical protein
MRNIMNVGILVLLAALPSSVRASQQALGKLHEKTWEGTLTAVDTQDNTVKGKHLGATQTFHLGNNCVIAAIDKKEATLSDLRTGEKVRIHYQNAEGVFVADRIAERALRYDGTVKAVDPKAGTMTMAEAALYQPFRAPETFRAAGDCKVFLANGDHGTLADVRPGDRVTVIYELPGGSRVAFRIRERSSDFVGMLDAIDLPARTVKAKKLSVEKTFNLADRCQIVADNQHKEHLRDLVVGKQYRFIYRNVDGINVLDEIAPAQEAPSAETASAK